MEPKLEYLDAAQFICCPMNRFASGVDLHNLLIVSGN